MQLTFIKDRLHLGCFPRNNCMITQFSLCTCFVQVVIFAIPGGAGSNVLIQHSLPNVVDIKRPLAAARTAAVSLTV